LGEAEEREHRALGARAAAAADLVGFFGPRSRRAFEAFRASGTSASSAAHFTEIEPLLAWLSGRLRPGDTVLVKGSRGMRLERVVEGLTAGRPGPGVREPA
ncbi:MAG TPA: UDP-N-acetylmuramoyl-tripeptide--D-alanyl-D-alanine ligase, partial [Thermoanaerobaculia bacterium]|nr:UDP-N-acetylmuramoyl-tripeptide--D-alanyl-D-alanine ligase [Thermoanaerobaculia bacterium]